MDGSDPRAVGGEVAASALTYSGPVGINGWTVTLESPGQTRYGMECAERSGFHAQHRPAAVGDY